jgi:hypothetical protein
MRPYVHLDHPLSYVLDRMGAMSVDVVPVVSRANIREMYGVVTLADVLATYGVSATRARVRQLARLAPQLPSCDKVKQRRCEDRGMQDQGHTPEQSR